MLENYRSYANSHLNRVARPFLKWSPDTLSWLSFALSASAGVLLLALGAFTHHDVAVPLIFFEVASLVFMGGVFDVLDGHVARARGLESKRGDFLDHVLDRYADTAILLGLSFSGWVNPYLGLLALASMLLSSYMGTQAQAVAGKRIYKGYLGRADRIVLVSFAMLIMSVLTAWDWFAPAIRQVPLSWHLLAFAIGPLDLLLLYFVVAGQATGLYRAFATWKVLGTA